MFAAFGGALVGGMAVFIDLMNLDGRDTLAAFLGLWFGVVLACAGVCGGVVVTVWLWRCGYGFGYGLV